MKHFLTLLFLVALVLPSAAIAATPQTSTTTPQTSTGSSSTAGESSTTISPATSPTANPATVPKKRGPIFRAIKDQIKQAQTLLKERGHYAGEVTGKLDPDTRAALKKYQEAESIKVTGTLNRVTLEKMNVPLTEKQKSM